jgi:diguanylate cyclase (GGDEF)-like protein
MKALEVISLLFDTVRHYGFERGRVNVVLNEKQISKHTEKHINFLKNHQIKGDLALNEAITRLKDLHLDFEQPLLDEILKKRRELSEKRVIYEEQFSQPFSERDSSLDDDWFNLMSQQIANINKLFFSINENNKIPQVSKEYFDILYTLSLLRDDAGPVVSYLSAAKLNRASLTVDRTDEISQRKYALSRNIDELIIYARVHLSPEILDQAIAFRHAYLDELFAIANNIIDLQKTPQVSDENISQYLQKGVVALEALNQLSDLISASANSYFVLLRNRNLLLVIASIALSITITAMLIVNLLNIYNGLYKRIIYSSEVVNKLSSGNADFYIENPKKNDELGDIETGLLEFQKKLKELNLQNKNLEEISIRDSLTQLYNHHHILQNLAREHENAKRYEYPYSVMMLDIDYFKSINDTFGHQTGDVVLRDIARILKICLRLGDMVGRYGGEEFLAILPHTPLNDARTIAEKIRCLIAEKTFSEQKIQITISIGVAEGSNTLTATEVVKYADQCLYLAKHNGRNRVEIQSSQPTHTWRPSAIAAKS